MEATSDLTSKRQALGSAFSLDVNRIENYNSTPTYLETTSRRREAPRFGGLFTESLGRPALKDVTNKTNDFQRPRLGPPLKNALYASDIYTIPPTNDQTTGARECLQVQPREAISVSAQDPLLSLSHVKYGLSTELVQNFSNLGIKTIYPWQSSCLLGRGLLTGEMNLVYTAPTGGGKSLIADVLMLKKIIENPGKKAILVLPYVALVQEKSRWLRRAVDGVSKNLQSQSQEASSHRRWPKKEGRSSIRVAGYFGGSKSKEAWADVDIAVCTIEKVANSLLNSAIEDGTSADIGVVVLDELHMIDDDHRGYLMELIATKLLILEQDVQIVGMSATLSNTKLLATWLGAKFYQTEYQAVPIEEYLVYENAIYPASTSKALLKTATHLNVSQSSQPDVVPARRIQPSEYKEMKNPTINAVISLTIETVKAGYGALVFCSTRKGCELDAALISEAMPCEDAISNELLEARREVLSELRNTVVGLEAPLEKAIMKGVGFHHAGLTSEEQEIIARAYDSGTIKVIIATCSLAAGINLPARRVILHGARMGRDFVAPAMLRQMRGRAGRKGKDELGESYLCCQKSDLEEVVELIKAEIPDVDSCLVSEKQRIRRALLEVIVTRLVTDSESFEEYLTRTLLYHSAKDKAPPGLIQDTITSLVDMGLITSDSTDVYEGTLLGQAIVAASLTPEDGITVHDEIKRALRAFVMDGEMHIFYMFTPLQSEDGRADVNWQTFRDEMDGLDESGLRVLEYVGINPGLVVRLAQGAALKESTSEEISKARIYRRFYAAFQLRDLCNEIPIHTVAKKYDVPRGFVQTLAQTSHNFASGIIKFCERMQWGMLAAVLEHMRDRVIAGARADLLDLAKIPFIKSRTARVFWENGMKSVRAVAAAEAKDIVSILLLAQPRKVLLDEADEQRNLQKLTFKAEIIVNSANKLWEQETAVMIEE